MMKEEDYLSKMQKQYEAMKARDKELGRDLETIVARYGNNFKELIHIINKHDPINLISIGCPSDEYLPEARTIIVQLNENLSVEEICSIVHIEFQKWFSVNIAGSKKNYYKLAKDIHKWISKGGLSTNK